MSICFINRDTIFYSRNAHAVYFSDGNFVYKIDLNNNSIASIDLYRFLAEKVVNQDFKHITFDTLRRIL